MLSPAEIAVAVAVVAAITFACRLAPFVLLRGRPARPLLDFLSRTMPLGVMVVLVGALPGWIGATAALHLWRRSIALSLDGGTGVYVAASLLLG